MTAKQKYIKDNRLSRLSKKQKELIFCYEPWLSIDSCAVSAIYQIFGCYENDTFSERMEYARQNAVPIYEDGRHIGTVVDMRRFQNAVE